MYREDLKAGLIMYREDLKAGLMKMGLMYSVSEGLRKLLRIHSECLMKMGLIMYTEGV